MEANKVQPRIMHFSSEEITLLRRKFNQLDEVTSFAVDKKLASMIASYGICREIGTVNDEMARFIFDCESGLPVRLESLKSELIEWRNLFGLRIYSTESERLELRAKGLYELVHPNLSKNADGTLHSLYIFPEIINNIVESRGLELVIVKSWGLNSIFGGFDPAKSYYQTNFWELENNDVLKFSDLIRQGKIAFMGTHDLVAHIANIDSSHWPLIKENAEKVYTEVDNYFKSVSKPSISALILPYTIGVVLDDLAQPPSYSSKSHIAVLEELLLALSARKIPANTPTVLAKFPDGFQKIIDMSRTKGVEKRRLEMRSLINSFVEEILKASLMFPAKLV